MSFVRPVTLGFLAALSFSATACGAEKPTAAPTSADDNTTTVASSAAPPATSMPVTSIPTGTTSTTASVSKTAIRSINVEAIRTYCIEEVGADLYQIGEYCSKGGEFAVKWTARGEFGDVESEKCAVVVDVTGPGDLNERRRSGECSGQDGDKIDIDGVPGTYTINVSVTPPDGEAPVTAVKTLNVLAYGS